MTLHNTACSDKDGSMEIFDGLDNIANRETRSAWATLAQKGTSHGTIITVTVDANIRNGQHIGDPGANAGIAHACMTRFFRTVF